MLLRLQLLSLVVTENAHVCHKMLSSEVTVSS